MLRAESINLKLAYDVNLVTF